MFFRRRGYVKCLAALAALSFMAWLYFEASQLKLAHLKTLLRRQNGLMFNTSRPSRGGDMEYLSGRLREILSRDNGAPKIVFNRSCTNNSDACVKNCSRPLHWNPDVRLREIIESPNLTLSRHQLDTILSMADAIPESDVIFLSASSSNHYDEMQAMFHRLHTVVWPLVKDFTVVFFDIGLTPEQRMMTEKHCRCRVITFPKEMFPVHVADMYCYSWKPLIARAVIEKARKLLVYMDASIRWSARIPELLNRTMEVGLQLFRPSYMARIPLHTVNETFQYFRDSPCAYDAFPEMPGGLFIYRKDLFNIRAILEPWARCALEAACMCPVKPMSYIWCHDPPVDHRCHRFDQSAIGIITAKLFGSDIYRVLPPDMDSFVSIQRGHQMPHYFNATESIT